VECRQALARNPSKNKACLSRQSLVGAPEKFRNLKLLVSRWFAVVILFGFLAARPAFGRSCVWKVTDSSGHVLYLGGSVHALRSSDYPLPSAFDVALRACSRLVFEEDPAKSEQSAKELLRAGTYPKGDNLKNHVDPRTYNYLRRFFALLGVPETKFNKYRPWLINLMLASPSSEYLKLGVERYLASRARAASKPVFGLESPAEHNAFFVNLNDREAEALLLILFINASREDPAGARLINAWRRGDAEALTRMLQESFREVPALGQRLIDIRNRNWLPKIEGYLRSGKTYFVVVGAGHMGGPNGLLALLKARGYKIEQLP